VSWSIEITEQCERDFKNYQKKRPLEFQAVMQNLEKYHTALAEAAHPRLVQFGFLHEEPKGILAIDQSGGGVKKGKLQQTRLYTYAVLESNVLHLLCMGSKTTQPKDIRFATARVDSIRSASGAGQ